ncbi:ATP-dependent helicase [Sphingomonas sp. 3-13AW]|uniref:ATP-dependent helicase n=1 Tax=Sphingomonas sp. 3-13AW TaxID=3050450 RepID=UPI003BB6514D
MKDIYQGLNEQQLEVVKHRGGSCIVVAGPGSGKTRSITTRAGALVREGVPPESILMLTFTRASYQTMLKRAKAIDPRCEFLTIGTYHAIASKIINQNFHLFDKKRPFTVLDGDQPATIISEIMEPIKGVEKNWPRARSIAKVISFAVNTGQTIEQVMLAKSGWAKYADFIPQIEKIADLYARYKYDHSMIDYDDCLQYFGALLVDPQIGPLLRQRWRYVMGDEHQDTNVLQLNIVQALAMDGMDLMVVGDPSQSIYGFRGSAPATMTQFQHAYPDSRVINLEVNYRSTPEIIDLVNAVDKKMGLPFQRTLVSGRPSSGIKPTLVDVMDTAGEAAAIVESILKDKADGGEISDHAILVRSMTSGRRIETELIGRQIPYKVMGGIKINEALHVRDLLDILRLTQNVQHEPAWMAVLTRFPKVGPKGARPVIDLLMKSANIAEAIDVLEGGAVPSKVSFQPLADALRDATLAGMPAEAVQEVISAMKPIWSAVWFEDWEARMRDLDAINTIAEEYSSISDFITAVTLDGSYDRATKDQAQMPDEWPLTISTIHSAKGLEWKHVHIPGFTQFSIPSAMAETDEEIAEEWRVFFVAVSRAERTLRLYKPRLSNNGKIIERSVFEETIQRFVERENGVKAHQISAGPIETESRISIPALRPSLVQR